MKKLIPLLIMAFLAITILAPTADAIQDPYIIQVTVTDEDGVAVEGATVTVTHISSEASDSSVTDSTGWAYIPLESIATYSQGDDVRIDAYKGTATATETFDVDLTSGNEWGYASTLVISTSPLTGAPSPVLTYLLVGGGIAVVIVLAIIWLKTVNKK